MPAKGLTEGKNIRSKQLPGTMHTGSYEGLHRAYKALLDYAREKGYTCITPSREVYHKGPGMIFKGNPNKYVTEIIIPVEYSE
ncbi:GyrI-like domain-containing protein [Robinsoniella peoriensis]|uniref:GyrI-like domain-containing protein n=1 Tax=Robinsoniella peoriensis TaxID=180332 RepID=UPI0037514CC1